MPPAQIGHALRELEIVWISSHTQDAKGRMERLPLWKMFRQIDGPVKTESKRAPRLPVVVPEYPGPQFGHFTKECSQEREGRKGKERKPSGATQPVRGVYRFF
jgi:hypothetical protein